MAPPRKNTPGVCAKCGTNDPAAFAPGALKRLTAWCKACLAAYKREVQPNGQPRAAKYQTTARRRKSAWLSEQKVARGCERCGENDPACLDFHHRDETTKGMNIGTKLHFFGKERLAEEIAKTTVLCSNCHRKLHYYEKSGTYARMKEA